MCKYFCKETSNKTDVPTINHSACTIDVIQKTFRKKRFHIKIDKDICKNFGGKGGYNTGNNIDKSKLQKEYNTNYDV